MSVAGIDIPAPPVIICLAPPLVMGFVEGMVLRNNCLSVAGCARDD